MAIQYTIRNIPPRVDKVLKQRSKLTGKSFNQVVVDTLSSVIADNGEAHAKRIEDMFGQGGNFLDDKFDEAIADLSKVDQKFWNEPNSN